MCPVMVALEAQRLEKKVTSIAQYNNLRDLSIGGFQ